MTNVLETILEVSISLMPKVLIIWLIIWPLRFVINIVLEKMRTEEKEVPKAQEIILEEVEDMQYERAEKYAEQFDDEGRIKCEYCDLWQLPNDSGKCTNCGGKLNIKKF